MSDQNKAENIHRINYLTSEMNALYHHASLKLGISDSVSNVLYTVYDKGACCLLSDVYKACGISRQTVNSAIRKLEAEGILYLTPYSGRSKQIILTEQGRAYTERTAARLFEAEVRAFDGWTEEEIQLHIRSMERYTESLRRALSAM